MSDKIMHDINVVCPYCNAEQGGSHEWAHQYQNETECECDLCGKTVLFYCELSITCISYPDKDELAT